MKQFTAEEIQAKYESLPKVVQDAISSVTIKEKIEEVGTKYGLHIDQIGDLVDHIGLVMLGLKSPSNFVSDLASLISINKETAKSIANEINKEVFETLRESMDENKISENTDIDKSSQISSLEKLGGFSIEKSEGNVSNENSAVGNEGNGKIDVSEADRASILYGIENPVPGKKDMVPKETFIEDTNTHTDPLIDHLLANPSSTTEQKIEKVEQTTTKKPIESEKPRSADPYREPIN